MRRRVIGSLILASLALAACGGAGAAGDGGAIALPKNVPAASGSSSGVTLSTTPGPALSDVALQGSEAPLSWLVEFPSLQPASPAARRIDADLRGIEQAEIDRWKASVGVHAAALTCQSDALVDSSALLSVRTQCSSGHAAVATLTATYAQATGARLALGDLFRGNYLRDLSAEAVTQLSVGGSSPAAAAAAAPPTQTAFSAWALAPGELEVTFALASGPSTVSFALGALAAFVRPSPYLSR